MADSSEVYEGPIRFAEGPKMLVLRDHADEVFRVTPEGRVMMGDADVTYDDAALAECFRKFVRSVGIDIPKPPAPSVEALSQPVMAWWGSEVDG